MRVENTDSISKMLSYNLPDDLVEEILSWLPLISLRRFKSVCKSWYALISLNPNFIIKLQNRSSDKNCVLLIKRFIESNRKKSKKLCVFSLLNCCFESGSAIICCDLDHLPFMKHLKLKYVFISPPCNGVFCLVYWGDSWRDSPPMYLWNPSINGDFNFKALPLSSSPPPPPNFEPLGSCVFGFGFDPKTNGYKAVRIWTFVKKSGGSRCVNKVEVCRVGDDSNSWREIDAVPINPITSNCCCSPLYANGKYYWKLQFRMPQKLVWFDFADEVFEETELPNAGIVENGNDYWQNIVALNDSIALISFPLEVNDKCVEVWLMNKDFDGGSQLSWTKYMTLEMPHSNMRPLRLLANGVVVLRDDKRKLHLYNSATRITKNLGLDFNDFHELVFYNESLVSFKEDMLQEHGNDLCSTSALHFH